MKRWEIKNCIMCDQGVCHGNVPFFYKLQLSVMGLRVKAVERQVGLEMMMGNASIVYAMGPDEDIATEIDKADVLLCQPCAIEYPIPVILKTVAEKTDDP